jgi:hypothetical protein
VRRERRLAGVHVAVGARERLDRARAPERVQPGSQADLLARQLRDLLAILCRSGARVEVRPRGADVEVGREDDEKHRAEAAGTPPSGGGRETTAAFDHVAAFGGAWPPPLCGTRVGHTSPVLADSDLADAERQLGRAPRSLVAVAARCPFGRPSVLVQAPYGPAGEPFPTLYWLSCPALVQAIGRVEGAGGIELLADELARAPELASDHAAAERRLRDTRRRLADPGPRLDGGAALEAGIAGEAPGGGVKCLHAHAALALADPPYLLGERALALADARYPETCCLA